MDDLNKANESLSKLRDSDVRIIYLPPMAVAAAYASGQFEWGVGPEATGKIEQFVWETGLLKIKPDARGMGFDCSREDLKVRVGAMPTAYEAWVSIPDDMEVKAPLIKKTFGGGLYAAHVLRDWNFQRDWGLLKAWAAANDKYDEDARRPCFEEVLNYYNLMQGGAKMEDTQIDLLLPIKEKDGGITMNKYENAMKLMNERCGNANKDNLIALATISLSANAAGNPRPSVRMVCSYYEDGVFYVSTSAQKSKMFEIEKNNEVAIGGLDWFVANGTAENLGWVKDENNTEIRAKMKKVFAWFDDHGDEDSPDSIVLRITLTNGTITDNEQKYGEWQYKVDFANKTAE